MQVMMVINRYYPNVGGNETQGKLLSEELVSMGTRVSVVTTWIPGLRSHDCINGVKIYRILPPFWPSILCPSLLVVNLFLFIFLFIKRKEFEIIHSHQALCHALGSILAAKLLGKKSLVKVSGGGAAGNIAFWKKSKLTGLGAIAILKRADCIVSLSEEIEKELAQVGICDNVIIVPNGVRKINISMSNLAEISKIKDRFKNVAVYVGRLTEEKGVDILLRAWKQVLTRLPLAGLIIIGSGLEKAELLEFVEKNRLGGSVIFTGEKNNIKDYLFISDIFILPSRSEGMSNALLEAMSNGLPCIASKIGGNTQLIKHGVTGMLFNNEDPQDLSKNIIEVFENKKTAEQLGNNAKELIRMHYLVEAVAAQYMNVYRSFVSPL